MSPACRDSGAEKVAASVGPYGAARADGSEYTGDYDLDEEGLLRWHRERFAILADAGADLLACETIPSFAEARARARGKSARRTAIRPLLKRAVHEAPGGDEDGARALGASERRRTNPERRPSAAYEKRPALVGRRMEKV